MIHGSTPSKAACFGYTARTDTISQKAFQIQCPLDTSKVSVDAAKLNSVARA